MGNIDPFVKLSLVDESIENPTEASVALQFSYLQPYFSGRGIDNIIKRFNSPGVFQAEIGSDYDNVSVYGHGAMVANQVLRGGGIVDGCRLMPIDAVKASLIVSVAYRPSSEIQLYLRDSYGNFTLDENGDREPDGAATNDGYEIRVITNVADLVGGNNDVIGSMTPEDPDEPVVPGDGVGEDWVTVPLMMVTYDGSGLAGNDFGLSIKPDPDRDGKFSDGRRYILNIVEQTPNGSIVTLGNNRESLSFALNPTAVEVIGSDNLDALDVNFDEYKSDYKLPVSLTYYENNYLTLIAALDDAFDGDLYDLDVLFAEDDRGVFYDSIVINDVLVTDVHTDLSEVNTFFLGGSDGELALVADGGTAADAAAILASKTTLLQEFYRGNIDDTLFDPRLIDCGITLDAWHHNDVKQTMLSEFGAIRDDVFRYVDCGDVETQNAAETVAATLNTYISNSDGYMCGIVIHSGKTLDRGRNIRTSGCYEIARSLPELYIQRGRFTVFAGWKSGRLKHMEFDFLPRVVKDNLQLRPLQNANLIFAMKLGRGADEVFWMSDDNQYSIDYSVLGSIRNAIHSGEVKRTVNKILIKYPFHPEDAEAAIKEATTELTDAFGDSKFFPTTIPVTFEIYQTKNDRINDEAHVDVFCDYPGVVKTWNVTLHIRRQALA